MTSKDTGKTAKFSAGKTIGCICCELVDQGFKIPVVKVSTIPLLMPTFKSTRKSEVVSCSSKFDEGISEAKTLVGSSSSMVLLFKLAKTACLDLAVNSLV